MIQARIDSQNETILYQENDHMKPGNGLQFVRFGRKEPYDMAEFHPQGVFFMPRVKPISWICLSVDEFLENMEDICRKEKGFFDPPV